jgi:DUF1365 family protein
MSAALFSGRTVHARLVPFRHRFAYRLWMVRADVDSPPRAWLFRLRILSLNPRDHGPRDGSPLRPWVEAQLAAAGIRDAAARIDLLAMPRLLGWVFNPISLYLCNRADGSLGAVLYETKNTFGDQHAYVARLDGDGPHTHSARKRLHVSPFFDMQGGYRFALSAGDDRLSLLIRLDGAEGARLVATLSGRFTELTDAGLLRALIAMPFVTLKVWLLIHVQALKLWRRGAVFHRTPPPPETPSSAAITAKTA